MISLEGGLLWVGGAVFGELLVGLSSFSRCCLEMCGQCGESMVWVGGGAGIGWVDNKIVVVGRHGGGRVRNVFVRG